MSEVDVKINRCSVHWSSIPAGILLYTLHTPIFAAPVGFVWGTDYGRGDDDGPRRFELIGSYTIPDVRRQGVLWRLHEQLFEHYDVILTGNASDEGGHAFAEAAGYRLQRNTGLWVLTRAAWRKRLRKRARRFR